MSDREFAGQTAIVGIGGSEFARLYRSPDPDRTGEALATQAIAEAVADAGLQKSDIDGLITGGLAHYEPVAYRTGLTDVRFVADYPQAGRMCSTALMHAATAVHHRLADYVVLFNSVTFRTDRTSFGAQPQGLLYDPVYGMASPGAQYSLAFTRYQAQYGGTEEQLGAIPVAIRSHARMNPVAIMQQEMTIDDYLHARYVAQPLRLFDYCLVNDGAVAYVVTTAERARDLAHPPVLIAGTAGRANFRQWYVDLGFWEEACRSMKSDLFDPLGVTTHDIDCLQVYDNFSVSVLWGLEGFGFAPRGQGLEWVQDGRIALGGELPVNTSGGMLSEAYLQGWNQHAEAVRQLRGTAGARQVADCDWSLYWCLSALPGATLLCRDGLL
ncbi:thiolase C-terminal domain-containing protein [Candidatus Poriferisocius sp.]|uniref:thiolase C-terminal domain-containing protein n=1 Tax=Candidatus Poriferisocius sp. TaxID=3101276 RepID=UPI003B5C251A